MAETLVNPETIPISDDDPSSPNHPLFLHQHDHPGLILISKKLTGSDNYGSWRRSMMIALNAKNKLKIVTGDYKEPEGNSKIKALWDRTNDMIISWILNTISDQISNSLTFVNSALDLWNELQEHYAQLDGHRICQLSHDIVHLKQSNCSIEVFYHKLKGFWDEIDALEAPYLCTCVCSCENGRISGERDQRKRLIQFLMGLDECYSNIRGQILLMQPLPSVAKAYGMIRQEEKQREGITNPNSSISVALSAQSTNNRSFSNNNKYVKTQTENGGKKSTFKKGTFCEYCKREGHSKDECYKIMGNPVGHPLHGKYKPLNKPQSDNKTVNMAIGSDLTANWAQSSSFTDGDQAINARMDSIQNQLNQVVMMMQQSFKNMPSGSIEGPQQEDCSWHPL